MASTGTEIGFSTSFGDMTKLIRVKEKELHEIHDRRCAQLENLVVERDNLLVESANKFEQLKDDFQYNLTLLDARDKEIERLESCLQSVKHDLEGCEVENRNFRARVELLEIKEAEQLQRQTESKATNKRILQDLKDVIEAMRWSAAEENKSKQREIDLLKDDIIRLNSSRDEALEAQRRDLTHTFETLLKQREESFIQKERDIAVQVSQLDGRFEQLQTDNSRLKSELSDLHRRNEMLNEEATSKEESNRQLQWRLDDERVSRQEADDVVERRLQQMSLDLTLEKDKSSRVLSDLQRQLEKALSDASREKEFRAVVEKRVEEVRMLAQQDISRLEAELRDLRAENAILRRDNLSLKEERDAANERVVAWKSDADISVSERAALVSDREFLRGEVEMLRGKLSYAEEDLRRKETALKEASEVSTEKALAAAVIAGDRSRVEERSEKLVVELTAKHIETVKQLQVELEDVEVTRDVAVRERDTCRDEIRRLKAALEEEREESKALMLRLSLLEPQKSPRLNMQQQRRRQQQEEGRARDEGSPRSDTHTTGTEAEAEADDVSYYGNNVDSHSSNLSPAVVRRLHQDHGTNSNSRAAGNGHGKARFRYDHQQQQREEEMGDDGRHFEPTGTGTDPGRQGRRMAAEGGVEYEQGRDEEGVIDDDVQLDRAARTQLSMMSRNFSNNNNSSSSNRHNRRFSTGDVGKFVPDFAAMGLGPNAAGLRLNSLPPLSVESLEDAELPPPSPLFSDDFGPASLPQSPSPFHSKGFNRQPFLYGSVDSALTSSAGGGAEQSFPAQNARAGRAVAAAAVGDAKAGAVTCNRYRSAVTAAAGGEDVQALADENERLKSIIREMRADVENLQAQVMDRSKTSTPHRDKNNNNNNTGSSTPNRAIDETQMAELQERLEVTVHEVTRLRNERKRLMDLNNELKATVNELQQQLQDFSYDEEARLGTMENHSDWRPPGEYDDRFSHSYSHGHGQRRSSSLSPPKGGSPSKWGHYPHHHQRNASEPTTNSSMMMKPTAGTGLTGLAFGRRSNSSSAPSSSTAAAVAAATGVRTGRPSTSTMGGGGGGEGGGGVSMWTDKAFRNQQPKEQSRPATSLIPGAGVGPGLGPAPAPITTVMNPPPVEEAMTWSQVVPGAMTNQLPIALTNSERTTVSQLKARRRLVQKGLAQSSGHPQSAKRVVINYAKAMAGGAEGGEGVEGEEEEGEEKAGTTVSASSSPRKERKGIAEQRHQLS